MRRSPGTSSWTAAIKGRPAGRRCQEPAPHPAAHRPAGRDGSAHATLCLNMGDEAVPAVACGRRPSAALRDPRHRLAVPTVAVRRQGLRELSQGASRTPSGLRPSEVRYSDATRGGPGQQHPGGAAGGAGGRPRTGADGPGRGRDPGRAGCTSRLSDEHGLERLHEPSNRRPSTGPTASPCSAVISRERLRLGGSGGGSSVTPRPGPPRENGPDPLA